MVVLEDGQLLAESTHLALGVLQLPLVRILHFPQGALPHVVLPERVRRQLRLVLGLKRRNLAMHALQQLLTMVNLSFIRLLEASHLARMTLVHGRYLVQVVTLERYEHLLLFKLDGARIVSELLQMLIFLFEYGFVLLDQLDGLARHFA